MNNIILTKEFLVREYWDLEKTQRVIAKDVGVSYTFIQMKMKELGIPLRPSGRRRPDLKNKKFGKLLVLEKADGSDERHPAWCCLCDCGKKCVATTSDLNSKISCPECSWKRTGLTLWKGYGDISGRFWSRIKYYAIQRNLNFDISIEKAWNLFVKQNKKCALTNSDIQIFRNDNGTTASFDRIDSLRGYVEGNVQWVHKKINIMKMDMDESEFVKWCKLVVERSA